MAGEGEIAGAGNGLPSAAPEFEIRGADGAEQLATNGRVAVTLHPDGAARMRKRNAVKNACTAEARKVQWLYAELDGVRAYLHDDGRRVHVILTRRDLYP